jgi:hypothetical protein
MSMNRRTRLLLLTLVVCVLAPVGLGALRARPARASGNQISIMVDDDQLINGTDQRRDRALAQMKSLGVEYVRVTLLWSVVTTGVRSAHAHGFNPLNPATYPRRNWDRFDNLVRAAGRFGIGIYFNITGPGPSWAMGHAPRNLRRLQRSWMPNPTLFHDFVYAVGRRYSGTYRKEDRGRGVLPRVFLWSLWNEPNQAAWLSPQSYFSRTAGRVIPYSPMLYRQLYVAGHKALVASGHGKDAILIGETSPLGRGGPAPNNPIAPKAFIRELLCATSQGVPYTGVAAAARDCSSFDANGPLQAGGWAHHPYTLKVPPTVRPAGSDDITIANIGDLSRLLDALSVTTGHIASGLPIASTEFGYETNPPDPYAGVPLAKQAEYINVGDFLAFQDPRVVAVTQFQLHDALPDTRHPRGSRSYWGTYQAGLLYANGRQKPAYAAYMLPLVVYKAGVDPASGSHLVGAWGQLRFHNHLSGPPSIVQLEYQASGSSSWQALGYPITVNGGRGFLSGLVSSPGPGLIRATWKAHMAPYVIHSRSAAVPS